MAARRGPHPDRAWRQGTRSADRLSSRHDAAAESAGDAVMDRAGRVAAVVSSARPCRPVLHGGEARLAGASAAGIPAAVLCRAQPGAGPALHLRLANAGPTQGGLLA